MDGAPKTSTSIVAFSNAHGSIRSPAVVLSITTFIFFVALVVAYVVDRNNRFRAKLGSKDRKQTPLVITAHPNQESNLMEVRDSNGNVISFIDAQGTFNGSVAGDDTFADALVDKQVTFTQPIIGDITGNAATASNAALLDGLDSTDFGQLASDNMFTGINTFTQTVVADISGNAATASDAALLDGLDSSEFAQLAADNVFAGALNTFDNSILVSGSAVVSTDLDVTGNVDVVGSTLLRPTTSVTDGSVYGVDIAPTATTVAGAVPVAASIRIAEPAIIGTPAVATTVYIPNAPSEGTANYAMWVESGTVKIGGDLVVDGTITAAIDTNIADTHLAYSNGTDLVGSANMTFDGTTLTVAGLAVTGDTDLQANVVVTGQTALNPAVLGTSNTSVYGTTIVPSTIVPVDTAPVVASLHVSEPSIDLISGPGTVTNAATVYIENAPTEGGTANYALWVASGAVEFGGDLHVSGTITGGTAVALNQIAYSDGSSLTGSASLTFDGTTMTVPDTVLVGDFGTSGGLVTMEPTTTGTSNTSVYGVSIIPTAIIPTNTAPIVASLHISEPSIDLISGPGTVTNAATVYIENAPSEGVTANYALWVASGAVEFGGDLHVGGTITGGTAVALNQVAYSDGSSLTGSANFTFDGTTATIDDVVIGGGTIDDTVIGGTAPALGSFTQVQIGTAYLDFSGSNMSFSTDGAPGGSYNTFFGFQTGAGSSTTGLRNSGFGNSALNKVTSGNLNTAVGDQTLIQVTTSVANTVIGASSFRNATGGYNIGVGYQSGYGFVDGDYNLVIGANAAKANLAENIRYTATYNDLVIIAPNSYGIADGTADVAGGFDLSNGVMALGNQNVIYIAAQGDSATASDNTVRLHSNLSVSGNIITAPGLGFSSVTSTHLDIASNSPVSVYYAASNNSGGYYMGIATGSGFEALGDTYLDATGTIFLEVGSASIFQIASAGVTVAATKTLTASAGGSLTGTWTDMGTVTTIDINGGTIDGTAIGGSDRSTAAFDYVAIGGSVALDSETGLVISNDITYTGASQQLLVQGTVTGAASSNVYGAYIAPSGITVPAGTTTWVASARIDEPTLTATGTITNAATLYIPNAPTEATNNYAVYVADGKVQVDDALVTGASSSITVNQLQASAVTYTNSSKVLSTDAAHMAYNATTGKLTLTPVTAGTDALLVSGNATIANDLTVSGTLYAAISGVLTGATAQLVNEDASGSQTIFLIKSAPTAQTGDLIRISNNDESEQYFQIDSVGDVVIGSASFGGGGYASDVTLDGGDLILSAGTITLSGYTANRVLYTNGSSIVSTDADFTFDGTTVTITDIDVGGGEIDNTPIGANIASTAAFTTLGVSDLSTFTPTASATAASIYGVDIAPTSLTAASGTIPIAASLRVVEPAITETTGTVTAAATVYIQDAPTEGDSNYALWVDAGNVRLDGDLSVSGSTTTAISDTQVVYSNSGVLAGSANFTFDGSTLTVPDLVVSTGGGISVPDFAAAANTYNMLLADSTGALVSDPTFWILKGEGTPNNYNHAIVLGNPVSDTLSGTVFTSPTRNGLIGVSGTTNTYGFSQSLVIMNKNTDNQSIVLGEYSGTTAGVAFLTLDDTNVTVGSTVKLVTSNGGTLAGTWTSMGTVSTIDIDGGTIDGVAINSSSIGATSASTGAFTTLSATGGGSLTGTWTSMGTVSTIDIDGGTIDGVAINSSSIGATSASTGAFTTLSATGGGSLTGTWTDMGTVATIDIDGGTIDGVAINGSSIGATSASTGAFTTLSATGGGSLTGTWTDMGTVTTIDIDGGTIDGTIIGNTTTAAGSFTTLGSSGARMVGQTYVTTSTVLSATDDHVVVADTSGGVLTLTLPEITASNVGLTYTVYDSGSAGTNNVTITGTSGQLINGAANAYITTNNGGVMLISTHNGVNYVWTAATLNNTLVEYATTQEHYVTLWAEEYSNLSVGYVFGYGNGGTSWGGDGGLTIQVPTGWTCDIVGGTFSSLGGYTASVQIHLNGSATGATIDPTNTTAPTYYTCTYTPGTYVVSDGDVLLFYCASYTASPAAGQTVVSIQLRYYKTASLDINDINADTVAVSTIAANQVVYADATHELVGDAGFTFDGSIVTVPDLVLTTPTFVTDEYVAASATGQLGSAGSGFLTYNSGGTGANTHQFLSLDGTNNTYLRFYSSTYTDTVNMGIVAEDGFGLDDSVIGDFWVESLDAAKSILFGFTGTVTALRLTASLNTSQVPFTVASGQTFSSDTVAITGGTLTGVTINSSSIGATSQSSGSFTTLAANDLSAFTPTASVSAVSVYGVDIAPASITAASGTIPIAASLRVVEPAITETAGTVTAAATVYIQDAPTEGDSNYALWVDAGNVKLDGDLTVDGTISGAVSGTISGTGITDHYVVYSNLGALAGTSQFTFDGTTVSISDIDVVGGTIDGTVIGGADPVAGTFTTGTFTVAMNATSVDINGGSINGTDIGSSITASGKFNILELNRIISGSANIQVNIDYAMDPDGYAAGYTMYRSGAFVAGMAIAGNVFVPITGSAVDDLDFGVQAATQVFRWGVWSGAEWMNLTSTTLTMTGDITATGTVTGAAISGPVSGTGITNTHVVYSNSGALTGSASFTFDGTTVVVPALTANNLVSLTPTLTGAAASNVYGVTMVPGTLTVDTSSALVSSLHITKPTSIAGPAPTVASTVYIADAPTEGGTNYALWVDAGNVKMDGNLTVDGTIYGNISGTVSTSIANTYVIYSNGSAMVGDADFTFDGATVTIADAVITSADINGGTIDGTVIGGADAAAGTFTDLAVKAGGSLSIPDFASAPASGLSNLMLVDDTGAVDVDATSIYFQKATETSNAVLDIINPDTVSTYTGALIRFTTGGSKTSWFGIVGDASGSFGGAAGDTKLSVNSGNKFMIGQSSTNYMTVSSSAVTITSGRTLTASSGGSLTGTWSDMGTVTTIDINGGTIDGVAINASSIGATSASTGAFTTLSATGGGSLTGTWTNMGVVTTIDINGGTIDGVTINSSSIGATTAASGRFSSLANTAFTNTDRIVYVSSGAGALSASGTNFTYDGTTVGITTASITTPTITGLASFMPTLTGAAAANVYGVTMVPGTLTVDTSAALVSSLHITKPTSIAGPAPTVASTVYIANAPTEGGTNYALWVDAGNVKMDGNLTVDGTIYGNISGTVSTSIANTYVIYSNGSAMVGDADFTFDGATVTMSSAVITSGDINGGTIDGVAINASPIGATSASTGAFTTLNATGGGSLTGTWSDMGSVTTIDINGGTMNGVAINACSIGLTSTAAAKFTSISVDSFASPSRLIYTYGSSGSLTITGSNFTYNGTTVGITTASITTATITTGTLTTATVSGLASFTSTVSGSASANVYGVTIKPTTLTGNSAPVAASLHVKAPTTIAGTATNAATVYIQNAPTAGSSNNYALWVDAGNVKMDGDLTVDGTIYGNLSGTVSTSIANTYVIYSNGSAMVGDADFTFDGTTVTIADVVISGGTIDSTAIGSTTASTGAFTTLGAIDLVSFTPTLTGGAAANVYGVTMVPGTLTVDTSAALVSSLHIAKPTSIAGPAPTVASTVYIADAPTEGGTNYALWVDSGNVKMDGDLTVDGTIYGTISGSFSISIPNTYVLYSNGSSILGDADFTFDGTTVTIADVVISGGTIDSTAIGSGTASTGAFTTLGAIDLVSFTPTLTGGAAANVYGVTMVPGTLTVDTSAALVSSLHITKPTSIAGPAPTVASTVYIADAPTEGATNYALWIDSGNVKMDGDLTVDGTISSNIANTYVAYSNSGALVGNTNFTFDGTTVTVPDLVLSTPTYIANEYVISSATGKLQSAGSGGFLSYVYASGSNGFEYLNLDGSEAGGFHWIHSTSGSMNYGVAGDADFGLSGVAVGDTWFKNLSASATILFGFGSGAGATSFKMTTSAVTSLVSLVATSGLTVSGGTLTAGTVDINGGAIDGTIIGGANAAAGSFTTLGSSGARVVGQTYVTTSTVLSATDDHIVVADTSGGVLTLTLPEITASNVGLTYTVYDSGSAGSNNVTITGTSGQLINGSANVYITTDNGGVMLISTHNGTNYVWTAATLNNTLVEYATTQEHYVTLWAEEYSNLSTGYVFSYGNGGLFPGGIGGLTIQVPTGWTCDIVGASFSSQGGYTASVQIHLNGSATGATIDPANVTTDPTYFTCTYMPGTYVVTDGDVLLFYCASLTAYNADAPTVVTVQLRYYKTASLDINDINADTVAVSTITANQVVYVDAGHELVGDADFTFDGSTVTMSSAVITSADINGGTIDGVAINASSIGATSASSGAFTTLSATGISVAADDALLTIDGAGTITRQTAVTTKSDASDSSASIVINSTNNNKAAMTRYHRSGTAKAYAGIAGDSGLSNPYYMFSGSQQDDYAAIVLNDVQNIAFGFANTTPRLLLTSSLATVSTAFTVTSGQTFSSDTVAITGGTLTDVTINSSSIGATSQSSGSFTTLAANNLSTFTPTASASAVSVYGVDIAPTSITAASGTIPIAASLRVVEPAITETAGTVTAAATVYIQDAPTEGDSNYALWVDAGNVKMDGNLTVDGTIYGNISGTVSTSIANTYVIYSNGSAMVGDADFTFDGATVTIADAVITSADINGGTIDGVAINGSSIGATSQSSGAFTTLTATGLTQGRLPLVSTGGLLSDNAAFAYTAGTNTSGISNPNMYTHLDIIGLANQTTYLYIKNPAGTNVQMEMGIAGIADHGFNGAVYGDSWVKMKDDTKKLRLGVGTASAQLSIANTSVSIGTGVTFSSDTVDIDGGAIDGTVIGGTTAAAGTFTTLTSKSSGGTSKFSINPDQSNAIFKVDIPAGTYSGSGSSTTSDNNWLFGSAWSVSTSNAAFDNLIISGRNTVAAKATTTLSYLTGTTAADGPCYNVFIGHEICSSSATLSGSNNMGIGNGAFVKLSTGRNNMAIGGSAAKNIDTGNHNSFVGTVAGRGLKSDSSFNTLVGFATASSSSGNGFTNPYDSLTILGACLYSDNITASGLYSGNTTGAANCPGSFDLADGVLAIGNPTVCYIAARGNSTTAANNDISIFGNVTIGGHADTELTGATGGTLYANTVDINGGTIDSTAIGSGDASTGAFTTLGAIDLVSFTPTLTGSAAANVYGVTMVPGTLTVDTSAALVSSLHVAKPTSIAGPAPTVASTVYIADAPTEGGTNYALWVDAGNVKMDGNLTVDGTIYGNISGTVSTSIANTYVIYSNGSAMVGDADFTFDGTTVTMSSAVITSGDINGGTIDGVTINSSSIGATTAASGRFSSLANTAFGNTDRIVYVSSGAGALSASSTNFTYDGTTVGITTASITGLASFTSTVSGSASANVYGVTIKPTTLTGSSAPVAASLHVKAPTTIAGTATNAATVYIENASTAGSSNNYALWVDAGNVKMDGNLTVDGTIYGNISGTVSTSIANTYVIYSNGSAMVGDADFTFDGATVTMSSAVITSGDINGGTIDGVAINASSIGATSASTGAFTTLSATGGGSLTGTWTDMGNVTTIDINGGTIDGVTINSSSIGATTAASGRFSSLANTAFTNTDRIVYVSSGAGALSASGTNFTYDGTTVGITTASITTPTITGLASFTPTLTGAAASNVYGVTMVPGTLTVDTSAALVSSLHITKPTSIAGPAPTVASTVYIADAPTEGVTNYALWVDAGNVKMDGNLTVDGTIYGNISGTVSTSIANTYVIYSNGSSMIGDADFTFDGTTVTMSSAVITSGDINGGTIDGVTINSSSIGVTNAAAGRFTTLEATSTITSTISNTQVVYSNSGALTGNANFTYNGSTLTAPDLVVSSGGGISVPDFAAVTSRYNLIVVDDTGTLVSDSAYWATMGTISTNHAIVLANSVSNTASIQIFTSPTRVGFIGLGGTTNTYGFSESLVIMTRATDNKNIVLGEYSSTTAGVSFLTLDDTNVTVGSTVKLVTSNGGTLAGTWTNMGTVTTIDINGGTIDGVAINASSIGATSASTGAFTTLSASSTLTTAGSRIVSQSYVTTSTNLSETDDNIVIVDTTSGAVTLTLPSIDATNVGLTYTIYDSGNAATNNVTITGTGGQTINGGANAYITTDNSGFILISTHNGVNYVWVGAATATGSVTYATDNEFRINYQAEETAAMSTSTNNGFQWSFGNGGTYTAGNGGQRINVPSGWTADIASVSVSAVSAYTCTIEAYLNNASTGATVSLAAATDNVSEFAVGTYAVVDGDILLFKTTSVTSGTGTMNNVSAMIRFRKTVSLDFSTLTVDDLTVNNTAFTVSSGTAVTIADWTSGSSGVYTIPIFDNNGLGDVRASSFVYQETTGTAAFITAVDDVNSKAAVMRLSNNITARNAWWALPGSTGTTYGANSGDMVGLVESGGAFRVGQYSSSSSSTFWIEADTSSVDFNRDTNIYGDGSGSTVLQIRNDSVNNYSSLMRFGRDSSNYADIGVGGSLNTVITGASTNDLNLAVFGTSQNINFGISTGGTGSEIWTKFSSSETLFNKYVHIAPTFTGATSANLYATKIETGTLTATGTATYAASLYVAPPVTSGTVSYARTVFIDGTPTGGSNNRALYVSGISHFNGSLYSEGAGYAEFQNSEVRFGTNNMLVSITSSYSSLASGGTWAALDISPTSVTIPSGTATLAASCSISPIATITGSVISAATLYIESAPTNGGDNYSLWVDSGNCKFDGNVDIDGTVNIGSGTLDSNFVKVYGTPTASISSAASVVIIGGDVTLPATGSNTVSSLAVYPPTITTGGATSQITSTLYVQGEPLTGDNKYSMLVDNGHCKFQNYGDNNSTVIYGSTIYNFDVASGYLTVFVTGTIASGGTETLYDASQDPTFTSQYGGSATTLWYCEMDVMLGQTGSSNINVNKKLWWYSTMSSTNETSAILASEGTGIDYNFTLVTDVSGNHYGKAWLYNNTGATKKYIAKIMMMWRLGA